MTPKDKRTVEVTVNPSVELGSIKRMNAVNNGPAVPPVGGSQRRGNFAEYKAARFPLARLHDSINCVSGGAHCVDITAVFPDFDADENDPASYDFVFTDLYLKTILDTGTKVFFRLGQTIEHGPRKYGVLPPKDFAKWARVCEHVIRHCNEGWADGHEWGIEYWEIWNEPDLDSRDERWMKDPRTWGGSPEQFYDLYAITATHLKKCFPHLRIGGPACAGNMEWAGAFLAEMRKRDVPIDFFSWHIYSTSADAIAARAAKAHELLVANGYGEAESILNEWNYVRGWTDEWVYSLRVESGDLCLKGAAYCGSVLCACQNAPVDMLMYYDARTSTTMNGLFERTTLWPQKPYYAFYAWAKLLDLGTQVQAVAEGYVPNFRGETTCRAVAARGPSGKLGVFVVRYNDDDNDTAPLTFRVRVQGRSLAGATCHLTDVVRTYTEVPLAVNEDGSADIRMELDSFAFIELA